MTTTTPPPATAEDASADDDLDVTRMFPADAELIVSPEGDARGLRELQAAARAEEASARS